MNRTLALGLGLALVLCAVAPRAAAQISTGGTPPGVSRSAGLLPAPAPLAFARPDVETLLAEDAMEGKDVPLRFGLPREVSLSPLETGQWQTLDDGSRLWSLSLHCDGATSTNLVYENFWLPAGVRFWLYSPTRDFVIGAYTEQNNKPDGVFATQPVPGEDCVLELLIPAGQAWLPDFRITRIVHGYRDLFGFADEAIRDYNDSGSCNNNVNCPEGAAWTDEINAVAMILTAGGFRVCTGVMINNMREDGTQYLLTANHCLGGENTWIFMFNYQSAGCGNQDGPTGSTVQGATRRANHADSDFALMEITEPIPASYNVAFSGWDRRNIAATSGVCIHHPNGDIKKISFENDPLEDGTWNGTPPASHWHIGDWEDGTTEPGSSGSPIYNSEHQIVGQLHGGQASCSNNIHDYFGKLSMSWDSHSANNQQLAHWLDPDDTGEETMGGGEANPTDRPNLVVVDFEPVDPEDLLNPGYNAPFIVRLQNTGILATGVAGVMSTLDNYVTVTDTQGAWPDIPNLDGAWNTANPFRFVISPDTPLGRTVNLTVVLTMDGGFTSTRTFSISVGVREVFVMDAFSSNLGWTLGQGWAIGSATAGGGQSGDPDPGQDYSEGTDNGILGFVIGGDYPNNMPATVWAESPSWDMTDAMSTGLEFQRWLGVDAEFWDHAYVQAWDGSAWTELWHNQVETSDGTWIPRVFDVSAQADGNPDFRVRFGMGSTNTNSTYCGWNVDDLTLMAFNTRIPVSYDPPLVTAPVRQGNDLLLAWQPTTPAPYYRVEWRNPSGTAGWQPVALTVLPELRIVRGYSAMGHTGQFRVVATDEAGGLEPVSRIPVEHLPLD